VRVYDEVYNPRGYRDVTPEGGFLDFVRLGDGRIDPDRVEELQPDRQGDLDPPRRIGAERARPARWPAARSATSTTTSTARTPSILS
jgi:hypothetical protein